MSPPGERAVAGNKRTAQVQLAELVTEVQSGAVAKGLQGGVADLLEVIEDRTGLRSTVVASQVPVDKWHPSMADPTLADAIVDRLLQASHRVTMKNASMRKRQPASQP